MSSKTWKYRGSLIRTVIGTPLSWLLQMIVLIRQVVLSAVALIFVVGLATLYTVYEDVEDLFSQGVGFLSNAALQLLLSSSNNTEPSDTLIWVSSLHHMLV